MAADPAPRVPLSRERILRAALELADKGGVEAVTMRRLGQALGYEAMSLYNHVANKDDLLDGMLDLVLDEMEPPAVVGDWVAAIRANAISRHEALDRHPWAAALLMSPNHARPAAFRHMDLLLARLREAGFSAETTYTAYHVLDAHVLGFSLWQAGHTYSPEEVQKLVARFAEAISPDEYPHLHEHAQQHMTEGPHREVSAFELGLDLILQGLEPLRRGA